MDSIRRPETEDPTHKWIGTYNKRLTDLLRFFKWLYSPDIEPSKRQKPKVIENIPALKRKEKSKYKASDIWTKHLPIIIIVLILILIVFGTSILFSRLVNPVSSLQLFLISSGCCQR